MRMKNALLIIACLMVLTIDANCRQIEIRKMVGIENTEIKVLVIGTSQDAQNVSESLVGAGYVLVITGQMDRITEPPFVERLAYDYNNVVDYGNYVTLVEDTGYVNKNSLKRNNNKIKNQTDCIAANNIKVRGQRRARDGLTYLEVNC